MSDLTEALAHYETHMKRYPDWKLMPETEALLDAARRWADLEALVADGARVVVETPCSCEPFKHSGPVRGSIRQGDQWVPLNCPGTSRTIILGEGATE